MSEIVFKKLNNYEIPELLKTIRIIKKETKSHDQNIDKIDYWNWKYKKLPSKKSLVYVALNKKQIVGYYHIPIYDFYIRKKKHKIGSIQSVAVTKNFRKKNIFKKLLKFANSDASNHLDLLYTFPNNKSIHTFLKYDNFYYLTKLPFYIYPINTANIIKSKIKFYGLNFIGGFFDFIFRYFSKSLSQNEKIIFYNKLDNKIITMFTEFNKKHNLHLKRSNSYFKWRYNKSSKSSYRFIGLEKNNKLKSLAVIKIEKIFKCKGILVMDFAYTHSKYLSKLLTNIVNSKLLKSNNVSFVLLTGMAHNLDKIQKSGFLKIPNNLVPRNLNLLFKSNKKSLNNLLKNKKFWLITLSDWDVF